MIYKLKSCIIKCTIVLVYLHTSNCFVTINFTEKEEIGLFPYKNWPSKILIRNERVKRKISRITVCYPDGKKCRPDQLCMWKGSVAIKVCKCKRKKNCDAPYSFKGKFKSMHVQCKKLDNKLQCFCLKGYEWSSSGKCKDVNRVRKKSKVPSGLPGSALLGLAILITLLAVGVGIFIYMKRRKKRSDNSSDTASIKTVGDTSDSEAATSLMDDSRGKSDRGRARSKSPKKSRSRSSGGEKTTRFGRKK